MDPSVALTVAQDAETPNIRMGTRPAGENGGAIGSKQISPSQEDVFWIGEYSRTEGNLG